jgi:predicted cupin superfamily sugar epimerase
MNRRSDRLLDRLLRLALLLTATLAPMRAAAPAAQVGTEARAEELIRELGLKVLPKESGYLGIIGVSAQRVKVDGRELAAQSQNYYMLTEKLPINYLHWLAPDDTHILIEGGPVDYYIFHPDGRAEVVTLGMDVARGERPVVAVPGDCWKALKLHKGAKYALMANSLSPEFTPDRVRIGEGAAWVKRFAGAAPWATPEALREMIGPNWISPQGLKPN